MKIKIEEIKKEVKYPIIMKFKTSGEIVLFTEPGKGIRLNYEVQYGPWIYPECEEKWELFKGIIELSND